MVIKLKFLAIILLLSGSSIAEAQSDSMVLDRCVTALQLHAAGYPVEKVHLHLDRPWYGLGDTIWFKAYTVVGERHQLSAVSNVLYAELINDRDSLVKRLTLQLNAGTAAGEFALPYTYPPGRYRIRAYTRWMRNDGPEYFFNRWVTVGGIGPEGTREVTRLKPGSQGNQAQQKAADNPD
ncbi:MAG: hypothetical protein M3N14_02695, partial [Bacteroidota bacterium]|nr:hypothetical protein [Bacteroidota bacterium]